VFVLLLGTVAIIAVVAFVKTRQSLGNLKNEHCLAVCRAITAEVEHVLGGAPQILEELVAVERDLGTELRLRKLPRARLAIALAARLKTHGHLSGLFCGEAATGNYLGARRERDGDLVIVEASPARNGGIQQRQRLEPSGSLTPLPPLQFPLDARQRPWFRSAVRRGELSWTEPYTFTTGRIGITAARPYGSRPGGPVDVVFGADFPLDGLAEFLGQLRVSEHGHAFLLDRRPRVVVSPKIPAVNRIHAAMRDAIEEHGPEIAALRQGQTAAYTSELDGTYYTTTVRAFAIPGDLEWVVATILPTSDFLQVAYDNAIVTGLVTLGALALTLLVAAFISGRISAPLHQLSRDLEGIGEFRISTEPPPRTFVKEVAVIGESVDRMKSSLRSFGKYVPTDVVRDILRTRRAATLGGETRPLTILFSDLCDFTRLSETRTPDETVTMASDYLEVVTSAIHAAGGVVDKYLGDGVLALFNAPNALPEHAGHACAAALRAQRQLAEIAPARKRRGLPPLRARIALHTGVAVVGNIGTADRFAYTALGDTVNLASRLESLNRLYGTAILGSASTRDATGPRFAWRMLDRVSVYGRSQPVTLYELLGEEESLPDELQAFRKRYEAALADYLDRRFAAAADLFARLEADFPDRASAGVLQRRCALFATTPPPPDWDGTFVIDQK
jgi:adenylate cyclase